MRPLTFLRAFGCVDDRYRPLRHGRCARFHAPLVDGIAYHPHGVHVLSIVGHRIARIVAFLDPATVATFGYDERPRPARLNP